MTNKKILIVGGGIAGLTMYRFLKNTGNSVTLIEKSPEHRADGAGIMLGINAMKILNDLGLVDQIVSHGVVLDEFTMSDSQGNALGKSDMQYLYNRTGYPTVAIHRTELHKILLNDLSGLSNSEMKMGITVEKISDSRAPCKVVFSNGDEDEYDLIISADGIHSSLRSLNGTASSLRYSGYTCWRFVIDVEPDVHSAFCINKGVEMWGVGKRLGIVPIGKDKVYCFATCNAEALDAQYQNLDVASFKTLFSEFGGLAPAILLRLSGQDKLIHGDLNDQKKIFMVDKSIVYLGDAAHAATPNMGQGAGMAIEDAYILSRALMRYGNIDVALSEYQLKRVKRVTMIRDKSYSIGRIAQWESRLAISVRNRLFALLPDMGLTKSQEKVLLDF